MIAAKATKTILALAIALTGMLSATAQAQTSVSSGDIQRLQDEVYQASSEISRLRTTDALQAGRLQDDLDTVRDEVTYLKVKLRKEGSVNRSEYTELRDRLQDLRTRARGDAPSTRTGGYSDNSGGSSGGYTGGSASGGTVGSTSGTRTGTIDDDRPRSTTRNAQGGIPVGTEIDVRLQSDLSSDNAQVEDRIEGTTVVDLYEGDRVIVPAGSVMRGIVTSVNPATRTDRKGSLTVLFNQITVRERSYPMRGTVTQAIESSGIRGEAGKIGAGSAVGAIIGGIIGGVKGALLGVLIGGGGTMIATEGNDVKLPAGTILRVRMDTPPEIR
jgi:TolA-binding protein